LCLSGVPSTSHAAIHESEDLELYGDFRLRLESDFDSQRADGSERDDRTRVRIRARAGLEFRATKRISFGLRLRSGSDFSHQSPHITVIDFDDNDTGDSDFNLDRWYVEGRRGRVWGWAGRNDFPFWKQNELFWDDDVTVAGLAGGIENRIGKRDELAIQGAYVTPPVGMQNFAGALAGLQVVYSRSSDTNGVTIVGGMFDYDSADPVDDPDAVVLRNGNGQRDYRIYVGSVQVKLAPWKRPLLLGLDYLHNGDGYSATDPDPITAAQRNEKDGLVMTLRYGAVQQYGDWEIAYYHARIETLAVIASYAQDDWVRWGSTVETDSSDLEGHEFRFVYGLSGKANLMARFYVVEAITSVQDGSRFRADFNYRF